MNEGNELLPFGLPEYKTRLENVRGQMRADSMDAAIITAQEDSTYLTGYPYGPPPRGVCLIVPLDGEVTMIERLIEGGNLELILGKTIDRALYWGDTTELGLLGSSALYRMIGEVLTKQRLDNKRIGVQMASGTLSTMGFEMMKKALPRASFVDATNLVERFRLIKSPAEIACIRRAARIASKGCAAGIRAVQEGVTENDVTAAIINAMLESPDYEFTWMAPHIAAGPRSAMAHTTWSGRILRKGDTVYIEIPASVNRYHAITLRIASVGPLSDKFQRVANVIREAQEAAIDTMKPGVRAGDVDKACRSVIEKAGYGEYFRHRTGYSIGIDWVQPHGVNLVPENPIQLRAGMTFHVIPICMFFGEGAVGMSDSVLVTEHGAEVLTELDRTVFVK